MFSMKKYIKILTLIYIISFVSCKSALVKEQEDVLNSYTDYVIKNANSKRVCEYGILYFEYEDVDYLKEKIKTLTSEEFNPNLNSFESNYLFNNQSIKYYLAQIQGKPSKLKDFKVKNKKTSVYTNRVDYLMNNYQNRFKQYLFPPILTSKKDLAIIFTSTNHTSFVYVFKKQNRTWMYYSHTNLIN